MKQFYEYHVRIINDEADTDDKGRVPDEAVAFLPNEDINIAHGEQYRNRGIACYEIGAEPVDVIDQKRFRYPEGEVKDQQCD